MSNRVINLYKLVLCSNRTISQKNDIITIKNCYYDEYEIVGRYRIIKSIGRIMFIGLKSKKLWQL